MLLLILPIMYPSHGLEPATPGDITGIRSAGTRLAGTSSPARPADGARALADSPAARVGPRALGRLGDGTLGACEEGDRSLARGTCPDAGSGRSRVGSGVPIERALRPARRRSFPRAGGRGTNMGRARTPPGNPGRALRPGRCPAYGRVTLRVPAPDAPPRGGRDA